MIRGAAISNIAWPSLAEAEALVLARQAGFTGIEIAPAKSVAGWPDQPRDVLDLRRRIEAEGLSVAALQAILFGMTGVELFASEATRQRLFNHFVMLARVAGQLGASACVYGAPRMRDPGPLEAAPALDRAVDFFRSVAPVFAAEGTCLAFEANAEMYGCRFITRTREAIELVRRVDHPGFRLQIDTGTVLINGEDDGVISSPCLWPLISMSANENLRPRARRAPGTNRSLAPWRRPPIQDGCRSKCAKSRTGARHWPLRPDFSRRPIIFRSRPDRRRSRDWQTRDDARKDRSVGGIQCRSVC